LNDGMKTAVVLMMAIMADDFPSFLGGVNKS
jgi:hypothetical protein